MIVGVLSVPTNEAAWSPRLRVYFRALNQYHARRRDTPIGIVMVTNLSGFPSSLTVIPVPGGDLRKHRADFFINENLKRLGCSGRVGLTLAAPNGATVAKFHQLYRTSDKNSLYNSVTELVRLCQAALHLFDVLEIVYADGLLCDVTEKAINDWWVNIGSEIYNIEPRDGILGPTTVAALLGLLLGSRARLHAVNAPVPKDPFDVEGMKRGIAAFQKSQHATRTRRLDHKTLTRLHKASEKAAYSEGWSVPRAVKSTVAELSGKGGEMLADITGRRDKAGIAEIETTDIDQFEQLAFGERCKWLWYGKPMKRSSAIQDTEASNEGNMELKSDEHGGFTWTGRKQTVVQPMNKFNDSSSMIDGYGRNSTDEPDYAPSDHLLKTSVIKRATGLISSEGRSGLDRLKGAVRGHHSRTSKDETPPSSREVSGDQAKIQTRPGMRRSISSPANSPTSPQAFERGFGTILRKQHSPTQAGTPTLKREPTFTDSMSETPEQSASSLLPNVFEDDDKNQDEEASNERKDVENGTTRPAIPPRGMTNFDIRKASIEGSVYKGVQLSEVLPVPEEPSQEIGPLLRRTQSYSTVIEQNHQPALSVPSNDLNNTNSKNNGGNTVTSNDNRDTYPRHLSFSILETKSTSLDNSHSAGPSLTDLRDAETIEQQYRAEQLYATNQKRLRTAIADLSRNEASWTETQLENLNEILNQAELDHQNLENTYFNNNNAISGSRSGSRSGSGAGDRNSVSGGNGNSHQLAVEEAKDLMTRILRDETESLIEGRRELETLAAKLEYEIGSLRGKVEDVEVGVEDFERAVVGAEARVQELEDEWKKGGTWRCVVS